MAERPQRLGHISEGLQNRWCVVMTRFGCMIRLEGTVGLPPVLRCMVFDLSTLAVKGSERVTEDRLGGQIGGIVGR